MVIRTLFAVLLVFNISALATQADAASAPFRSGTTGNIKWEVRFNHLGPNGPTLVCQHPGEKAGAHCDGSEVKEAAANSGIEDRLIEIMNLPEIRSVSLAYYSFSNSRVKNALCDAAKNKNLHIRVYIDASPENVGSVQDLETCSPNVVIQPVGLGFGKYIQHMKIFLATTFEDPVPLADLSGNQAKSAAHSKAYVVSSSGNMSSYGTSLHFDNWIFYETEFSENIIQQNLCALRSMDGQSSTQDTRDLFSSKFEKCRKNIASKERSDIRFYAVPHGFKNPQAYQAYEYAINGAKSEVMVAIHRLTTASMYRPWISAIKRKVRVSVIFDDDTLRRGKVGGQPFFDVGMDDVKSERTLRSAGAKITYMETGAEVRPHLFHSKFVVVDPGLKTGALFQGAGNFTSTALNIYGDGNFEQFYVIRVPEIVQAYADGWKAYRSLSTKLEDHPVGNNPDGNPDGGNGDSNE
jgi:hypothetical protein